MANKRFSVLGSQAIETVSGVVSTAVSTKGDAIENLSSSPSGIPADVKILFNNNPIAGDAFAACVSGTGFTVTFVNSADVVPYTAPNAGGAHVWTIAIGSNLAATLSNMMTAITPVMTATDLLILGGFGSTASLNMTVSLTGSTLKISDVTPVPMGYSTYDAAGVKNYRMLVFVGSVVAGAFTAGANTTFTLSDVATPVALSSLSGDQATAAYASLYFAYYFIGGFDFNGVQVYSSTGTDGGVSNPHAELHLKTTAISGNPAGGIKIKLFNAAGTKVKELNSEAGNGNLSLQLIADVAIGTSSDLSPRHPALLEDASIVYNVAPDMFSTGRIEVSCAGKLSTIEIKGEMIALGVSVPLDTDLSGSGRYLVTIPFKVEAV